MPNITSSRVSYAMMILFAVIGTQTRGDDLRGGGAYDTVSISGFLIPIEDVDTLIDADILARQPGTTHFSFGDQITSERQLTTAISGVALQDPRALRDLYRTAKVPTANNAAHTLTVPSGLGPSVLSNQRGGFALSTSVGGVSRVPYTDKADGGIGFGLSFGNAYETLGVSLGASINDLSDITNTDRMSLSFKVSRYISDGLWLSFGGENLAVKVTDGEASYYVAGSWVFDDDTGILPFKGVATLGVGSGRFANLTPRDTFEGKGEDGTTVFGAMSWEIADDLNLVVDWNGRNLSAGAAYRFPGTGVSIKLGLRDLAGNSGDGVRLTGAVGFTIAQF